MLWKYRQFDWGLLQGPLAKAGVTVEDQKKRPPGMGALTIPTSANGSVRLSGVGQTRTLPQSDRGAIPSVPFKSAWLHLGEKAYRWFGDGCCVETASYGDWKAWECVLK